MSREAFEAWMRADNTLPMGRNAHGYADFTAALMWHTWQAAEKTNAPEGAFVGEADANGRLGLAGANSTCAHEFALDHASSIRICQHCGSSELAAKRKPANVKVNRPVVV